MVTISSYISKVQRNPLELLSYFILVVKSIC
ncbi:hypothetical protein P872_25175 [Rhodonellum psychrophilum GCM71 = DSM 17998]|uniref:Uncharacterized protein n=1 Tax=Rhodonellum psychrophilum GCM71 = DSM 17998 TaxID=1123057 RepID=U5C692_9BACT|nr:hypothetical protein P872_25175 [Rhodonellum psychrophilum GCM71 = DSM 17998]